MTFEKFVSFTIQKEHAYRRQEEGMQGTVFSIKPSVGIVKSRMGLYKMQPIEIQDCEKKTAEVVRIRHLEFTECQAVVYSQYPNSSEYNEKIRIVDICPSLLLAP